MYRHRNIFKAFLFTKTFKEGRRGVFISQFLRHEIFEGAPLRTAFWSAEERDPDDTQGKGDPTRLNIRGKGKP